MRPSTPALSVLLVACGGAPTGVSSASTSQRAAPVATAAVPSAFEPSCDALIAAAQARDRAALRARAERQAEEYGESVEEALAELESEEAEARESAGPPTWTCPAHSPGYHLPQPDFPNVSLPGGRAALAIIERFTDEYGAERLLFAAFERPGGEPRFVFLGAGSDLHGQEWSQFHVEAFGADGAALAVRALDLECVPAGFTEELEDEPPACRVVARHMFVCTAAGECERETAEPLEEEWYP